MAKKKSIKRLSLWAVSFLVLMASVSAVSYFLDEGSAVGYKNKNPEFVFNAEDTKITEVEWDTDTNLLHVCWQSHYTRNNEDATVWRFFYSLFWKQ